MPNVKGFAIRGLLRYVKETRRDALPEILAQLSPEARASFDRPIIPSQWYPYRAFTELLRAIDRKLGRGDLKLCVEIGDFAAKQDLNGMFRMLMSVLSPNVLLERSNLFWSKYADKGTFKSYPTGQANEFVQRLEGFPEIDSAQCQVLIGFIQRWGLMASAREVNVRHSACVHKGDPYCEWRGTWR